MPTRSRRRSQRVAARPGATIAPVDVSARGPFRGAGTRDAMHRDPLEKLPGLDFEARAQLVQHVLREAVEVTIRVPDAIDLGLTQPRDLCQSVPGDPSLLQQFSHP